MKATKTIKTVSQANMERVIWGWTSLFYFYQFILRVSADIINYNTIEDLQLTPAEFELMVSGYYLSYSLTQIPLDTPSAIYNTQKKFAESVLACILGSMLLAHTGSTLEAYPGRFLISLDFWIAFLTCIKNITSWSSISNLSVGIELTIALGINTGGKLLALLETYLSWHHAFAFITIVVLYLSVGLILKTNNKKNEISAFTLKMPFSSLKGKKDSIKILLTSPQLWLITNLYFLIYSKATIRNPFIRYLSNKTYNHRVALILFTFFSSFAFLRIFLCL